jgi:hypothetical protein
MPTNARPYNVAEIIMAQGTRPFFLFTQKVGQQTIAKSAGWATLSLSESLHPLLVTLDGIGQFSQPNDDGVISVDTATELRLFPRQALGRRWLKDSNNPLIVAEAPVRLAETTIQQPPSILERLLGRRLRAT